MAADPSPRPNTFVQAWQDWKQQREDQLAGHTGPLTITALEWLSHVPTSYTRLPGLWWADGEDFWLDPREDQLRHNGIPVREPTAFTLEDGGASARFTTQTGDEVEVFRRGGFMTVARNPDSPRLRAFTGAPIYAPRPEWLLAGVFEPHDPTSRTVSSTRGPQQDLRVVGRVRFTRAGAEFTLPVNVGHNGISEFLSALFTDTTNGLTTYPAGRFLAITPGPDGSTVLDFTRATNLPCAFNPLISCPVPPPESALPFAVEAGERTPEIH
ncbi:DUF1684 domain-containing protein [Nocardia salmonicida]|uniref:DUF1684 domain-containing protein n=1 Tax=Nocardia salmonicida TaxID=53431 RepID=UPI0036382CC8